MKTHGVHIQAIIQARTGATRLPNKTLELIGEQTVLGWVIESLRQVPKIERIVIATTTELGDDTIEAFARKQKIQVFRGDEHDVLGRFAGAVERFPAKYIARITADNPLLHPATLAGMIATGVESQADHTGAPGGPIGATAELVSASALMTAHHEATDKHYREHVTPFLYTQPDQFKCVNHPIPPFMKGRGDLRVTIDTPEDILLIRTLHNRCLRENTPFDLESVLKIIDADPKLLAINNQIKQKDWQK